MYTGWGMNIYWWGYYTYPLEYPAYPWEYTYMNENYSQAHAQGVALGVGVHVY
jgi:hypothetical protein